MPQIFAARAMRFVDYRGLGGHQALSGELGSKRNIDVLAVHEIAFIETGDGSVDVGREKHAGAGDEFRPARWHEFFAKQMPPDQIPRRRYTSREILRTFMFIELNRKRQSCIGRLRCQHEHGERVVIQNHVGVQHAEERRPAMREGSVVICSVPLGSRISNNIQFERKPPGRHPRIDFRFGHVECEHDLRNAAGTEATQVFKQRQHFFSVPVAHY